MDSAPEPVPSPTNPRTVTVGGASLQHSASAPAVASLTLGILALLTSVIFVGLFIGLAGLITGAIHLSLRREGRRIAWAGVILSATAMLATAAAGFLLGTSRFNWTTYGSWIGKTAPDFEVSTLDGSNFKLSDCRGKRVVIDFWATWCGPCVLEIPNFIDLRKRVPPDELVVVGLSNESANALRAFVAARNINYPIASLESIELPAPFSDVHGLPTTFFLDRNGRIQHVAVGYRDAGSLHHEATAADPPEPGPPSVTTQ